jgi:hypothetical protein
MVLLMKVMVLAQPIWSALACRLGEAVVTVAPRKTAF